MSEEQFLSIWQTGMQQKAKAARWAAHNFRFLSLYQDNTPITASMRFFIVEASKGLMM